MNTADVTAAAVDAPAVPWTAQEVLRGLFLHFSTQAWAPLTEVTTTPPADWRELANAKGDPDMWERRKSRRIDMLCVRRPRKQGLGEVERLAIEVKVSRSDFLVDIRNPHKQAAWRELAHRHAYAAPAGLIRPEEVPDGSGLLEVSRWNGAPGMRPQVQWSRRAPYNNDAPPLPNWLILSFASRAAWAEAPAKGLDYQAQQLGDNLETVRAELKRTQVALARVTREREKAADLVSSWREAYGHAAAVACATCGRPIKPVGAERGSWREWRHAKADEALCLPLRAAAEEERAREVHRCNVESGYDRGARDADYWRRYVHVPGPYPAPIELSEEPLA